jgi:hypothetical protein
MELILSVHEIRDCGPSIRQQDLYVEELNKWE